MGINKLLESLNDLLDLSQHERQKKHKKLQKIIRKLEAKKRKLEQEVIDESKVDDTSDRYRELTEKLKVVSGLVKKAKKHDGGG